MNSITEKDIAQLEQKVVEHLTANLKSNGAEKLMKQMVEISARVSCNMIQEYHKLISGKST
jgi:hypothetical protein